MRPGWPCRQRRQKDLIEQLAAEFLHPLFDSGGDRGRRIVGMLEIILQIPLQVIAVLRGHRKGELGRSRLPCPRALQGNFDAVAVVVQLELSQP